MGKHVQQIQLAQTSPQPAIPHLAPQAPDFLKTWSWRSRARDETAQA
jgi:hypothetical protein